VFSVVKDPAHVADTRDFQGALRTSGKYAEVFEAGRVHVAQAIEERLARSERARHIAREQLRIIARMQAAASLSLVESWADRDTAMTAAEADEQFHPFFWRSVAER
jgi:hydroxypyruvate isomerase